MKIEGEARLLRIFIGESEKQGGVNIYEKIVVAARKARLAGATVYKGIMGFGGSSVIHRAKFLTLSEDLPVVIEIVDSLEKINGFIPEVEEIFERSDCGGLITVEKAEIIGYKGTSAAHDD